MPVTNPANWTTPASIRSWVQREWDRGAILRDLLLRGETYPCRINVRGPGPADMGANYPEVLQWADRLLGQVKRPGSKGYRIESRDINNRQIGANSIPDLAVIDTLSDAIFLIGKDTQVTQFQSLTVTILDRFPGLHSWISDNPLVVLNVAPDWPKLLRVLAWFVENPRPDCYLRQISVPGVDTKFIEARKKLLGSLLTEVLPSAAIDHSAPTSVAGFEQRYGLKRKPTTIRFRVLDAMLEVADCLTDVAIPYREFAKLSIPAKRVFITENETSFLAFPDVPDSIVIFGSGYGFSPMATASWLQGVPVFYWGDIDTHGFAILNDLRAYFPHARSFLMDRDTLLAGKPYWGQEPTPVLSVLPNLTESEQSLYRDLCQGTFGSARRFEQEFIPFDEVVSSVRQLVRGPFPGI